MAEAKKRGFHALEERIHQMEEEDTKAAREASEKKKEEPPRTSPAGQRPPEPKRQ